MPLPTAFTGNVTPTGEELDGDLAALGALTPIPCVAAGTNTITLIPDANTPTVTAYASFTQFTAVAAGTNTGPVTAQVGSLASLSVYKDTADGPVPLTGGEIVLNTKLWLMYDPALNSGAGGFHLISPVGLVTRNLHTTASISITAIPPFSGSTATVLLAGCSIGDIVTLGFPSLASIGLSWQGYVNNAGTITLNVFNLFSLATVTPNVGVYTLETRGFT
jgi:hypothetical protein